MRHPSFVLQLPDSVWKLRLVAVLILFTGAVAGAQETGSPNFTIKPLPVVLENSVRE